MMRMHAPPGCLLVGWSVHLQPSTSFQLASFPVRESPEVMGSLPAAALMRGAATCLADSFSCYLSLKVTLELVAATKYLHRSQNQNQTDRSFAYWEEAYSADCQISMAQPVGSTLATSVLYSSLSTDFVLLMALTGSLGVATHPFAPGFHYAGAGH